MEIKYSRHIKHRLHLRKIDYDLPKKVYELSKERYFDEKTGHFIAIMRKLNYRKRDVMIAYVIEEDNAKLFTIHPLKEVGPVQLGTGTHFSPRAVRIF